jgi:RNA polymerase sigma factor (TIGR02999 family)
MASHPGEVTRLLVECRQGSREALERLMPLVYKELRKLAAYHLRAERAEHTLEPTALVHEAYLRLVDQSNAHWQNRAHFFAVAAQVMRHILVDYARMRGRDKRGGRQERLAFDAAIGLPGGRAVELVALDDALSALERLDARQSRIVELRYFGGLSIEETAEVLGIGAARVRREWTFARAWLRRELQRGGAPDG